GRGRLEAALGNGGGRRAGCVREVPSVLAGDPRHSTDGRGPDEVDEDLRRRGETPQSRGVEGEHVDGMAPRSQHEWTSVRLPRASVDAVPDPRDAAGPIGGIECNGDV